MKLELVAAWSCTPDREAQYEWLKVARGSVGMLQADGALTLWHATKGAPLAGSLRLPAEASIALDPRGEVVACVHGGRLALHRLTDGAVTDVEVDGGIVAQQLSFRADGERLWLFGLVGDRFHAMAYDRALALVGDYPLNLSGSPAGFSIQLHPREDAFVLTLAADGPDPEAPIRRVGLRIEAGQPVVLFDESEIDHPCLGFTNDGRFLIGVEPFTRVMAFPWPTYQCAHEAALEPDGEGRPVGMIVGDRLITEWHSPAVITFDPTTQTADAKSADDSSLWVLALPTLEQEAKIRWIDRGFGDPSDDAGLDFVDATGDDTFLEARRAEGGQSYALRLWRLCD